MVLRRRRKDNSNDNTPLEVVQELRLYGNQSIRRPHHILYDNATAAFFVYATHPPPLSKFVWDAVAERLTLSFCQPLGFMKNAYARSFFTLLLVTPYGTLLTPTGVVPVRPYEPRLLWKVRNSISMNDLTLIDGWWYATSTTPCGIVRFRVWELLSERESLTTVLGLLGCFTKRGKWCGPSSSCSGSCFLTHSRICRGRSST